MIRVFKVSSSVEALSLLVVRTAKWASFKIEFDSLGVEGLSHHWEVSLLCRAKKVK